jgi:hypothetical protein
MNRPSIRFRSAAAAALLLAAAGCTAIPAPEAPPPAPPPPAAVPPSPAPPPPTAAWDARALDGGAWRYDAGSRTARFVPTAGANPLLTMACSGGAIRLTAGLDGPVALRTSAGTDQIRFDGGSATVPNRDIRLDRIAFSRGRFALEGAGRALTLPVQSEIGRVIEDCR